MRIKTRLGGTFMVTLFYDSLCPLCVKEMRKLSRWDKNQQLILEDIHHPDFAARFP
ncbi:DCC1-like thiol-disulfide oxidoreductase family protein, partial [Klebsiella pneumoniae]|uniref:DCC1-like thiol-disulfide oxidoreductase family protein n=1 Tax=Klebsiella pneumoniae TaxID=573 RepID=UPI003B985391